MHSGTKDQQGLHHFHSNRQGYDLVLRGFLFSVGALPHATYGATDAVYVLLTFQASKLKQTNKQK